MLSGRIGIALGSGASRGWAHIGVLRELEAAGIRPSIVCGSSIGAVVGAAYAAGRLDAFERWVRGLDRRQVMGLFDLSLRGGLIKARRVFESMAADLPDLPVASLPKPFIAVATDLRSGREVWLRDGRLHSVLRASAALPGLIRPVQLDGRWLVDGGLVNPVPVSVCRAAGADTVVAVDLNTALVRRGTRVVGLRSRAADEDAEQVGAEDEAALPAVASLQAAMREMAADLRQRLGREQHQDSAADPPSVFEVVMGAIGIMQVHITRSRMAGDPPDLLVTPKLPGFAMLDFDRAAEAIEEGRRAARMALTGGLLFEDVEG